MYIGILEKNGPSIAGEMRRMAESRKEKYIVTTINYDRSKNRLFAHNSLAMAIRRCGSINRGKLRNGGDFAMAVVLPASGRVYNMAECIKIHSGEININ